MCLTARDNWYEDRSFIDALEVDISCTVYMLKMLNAVYKHIAFFFHALLLKTRAVAWPIR
jgi:hypothetical protein